MSRIYVYKKCPACLGKGENENDQYLVNPQYTSSYTVPKRCEKCRGTGKVNTDMWIEDPYSLFAEEED